MVAETKTRCQHQQEIQRHAKETLGQLQENQELFFNESITKAEDERTDMAKNNSSNAKQVAIDTAHTTNKLWMV